MDLAYGELLRTTVFNISNSKALLPYLCNWVKRVCPLGWSEAHIQDSSGHLAGDHHSLYGFPHSLLGSHCYFKASK
jgi:hypothetical protein